MLRINTLAIEGFFIYFLLLLFTYCFFLMLLAFELKVVAFSSLVGQVGGQIGYSV
jgi:hypothetical protein